MNSSDIQFDVVLYDDFVRPTAPFAHREKSNNIRESHVDVLPGPLIQRHRIQIIEDRSKHCTALF